MELGIRRRYVLDVTLNNLYTQHFGVERRLFLEKLAGESIQHVVMKLLTWLITYRPGLEIEVPIGEHYKPDLVRRDDALQVTQWADCGQTSLTKLDAIVSRHQATEFTITKTTPSELRHYHRRAVARKSSLAGVLYLSFEYPGITPICREIKKRHRLVATVGEGPDTVYLSIDNVDFEVILFRLGGWPDMRTNVGELGGD